MAFDLDPDYKQVPERIADFKAKHPEGSLRPLNPERPYEIVSVEGQTFIVYSAAAFRHPLDPAPGVGTAWELVPGKTPYTKLSELQNAETSAWGRAIVAVLASESKAVASAEDVRNRKADHAAPESRREVPERVRAMLAAVEALPADAADAVMAEIRQAVWNGDKRANLADLPESWWPHVEKMIAKAKVAHGAPRGASTVQSLAEGDEGVGASPSVPAAPADSPAPPATSRIPAQVEARLFKLAPEVKDVFLTLMVTEGIDLEHLKDGELAEVESHLAEFEVDAGKSHTEKALERSREALRR